MIVNEIFKSIQGEGKYVGYPALFIRLSGCTRACDFCDTKYHTNGKKMTIKQVAKQIDKSGVDIVVWTGGEPMMQQDEILEVFGNTEYGHVHHVETNGDILPKTPEMFSYIAFSPKTKRVAENVQAFVNQIPVETCWDVKIVTDLKMNKDMIGYATLLMPLSTFDAKKDRKIERDVWNYCSEHNIKYTPRIHKDVWGQKVGV